MLATYDKQQRIKQKTFVNQLGIFLKKEKKMLILIFY